MPAVGGLPVDQHLGNLEGKELRCGTSAGVTFAAATVDVTCGSVNCERDSLSPIVGLTPQAAEVCGVSSRSERAAEGC